MEAAMSHEVPARVLVVADWKADPRAVVNACTRWAGSHSACFELLVPAWLHGLDWAGDPFSSVPCARRARDQIAEIANAAGLPLETTEVGDHDVIAAIMDVVLWRPVDQLLVCVCDRHQHGHPFDLAHRASRATGLPTTRVALPAAASTRPRHGMHWPGTSQCPPVASVATGPRPG
jgi:hypothetical protein